MTILQHEMCHMYVPEPLEYEPLGPGFYSHKSSLEVTPGNVRTWIQERDVGCLERVLWEGNGHLLLGQTSTNGKVRRLLEAVPKLMNEIREVHEAAVMGDVDEILGKEFRQPVYTSKDINGISAFHKAVSNGHRAVAEHLMEKTDRAVLELTDRKGRTAIHYAAGVAAEDDKAMFDWLVQFGADPKKQDDLKNTAEYYLSHGHHIRYSPCSFIPEAPRIKGKVVTAHPQQQQQPPQISAVPNGELTADEEHNTVTAVASPSKVNTRNRWMAKKRGNPEEEKENKPGTTALPAWNKISKEHISKWIKTADLSKLEHAVYLGKGSYMKGKAAWNEDIRNFLQTVPNIMSSIQAFHESATVGDLSSVVRQLSSDRRLIWSREPQLGRTALHKAARGGHVDVAEALLNGDLEAADTLAKATDKENRSALHYAAACENEEVRSRIEELLVKAGADAEEKDSFGNVPSYYYDHEFISKPAAASRAAEESQQQQDNEKEEVEQDEEEEIKEAKEAKVQKSSKDSLTPSEDIISTKLLDDMKVAVEKKQWETLVQFVLDGHGDKLGECKSDSEEVLEFLDNITAFQEKIASINKAVENGSLRELQNQLDRKKFALAKDRNTGVTFLHKAIVLGHSDIVRYLAANFPKTLDLADKKQRTSLHYAAVAKDGGHLYSLIVKAGATKGLKDEKGNTPEYYAQNKGKLTLKELQEWVKVSTFESRKPKKRSKSIDFKSQGSNVDIQNTFDEAYETSDYEEEDKEEKPADQRTQQKLEVAFRRLCWARESESLLKRFLTKKVYERLRHRTTGEGGTLLDVIQSGVENLDSAEIGAFCCDADAYRAFWPLFKPILAAYHDVQGLWVAQPELDWPGAAGEEIIHFEDPRVTMVQLEVRRSLRGFPLQPRMNLEQYKEMETDMVKIFESSVEGIYHSLYTGLTVNVRKHLEELGALFHNDQKELEGAHAYEHWPVGRGVYVSHDRNVVIWLNESDHLRVRVQRQDGQLGLALKDMLECLEKMEELFLRDSKVGFITLSPADLGTGLKVTVRMHKVTSEAVEEAVQQFNLVAAVVPPQSSGEGTFEVCNKRCFGQSERDLLEMVVMGVRDILLKVTI